MKPLTIQLFKTFLFSLLLSIAATSIYYAVTQKGPDYNQALPKIFEGIAFLNIIIFVMTLPALFLANPVYWNNMVIRLPLYFAGSITFMVTAFNMPMQPAERVVYLLTGGIFIIVHSVFYYLMVKKRA